MVSLPQSNSMYMKDLMTQYYGDMRRMIEWLRTMKKNPHPNASLDPIQLFFKKRKDLEHIANNYSKWVTEIHEKNKKKNVITKKKKK